MLYDVGIREAKINLSRLLKEVQKGKEIIITDRGKRIARITALDEASLPLLDRIKSLEASGILKPLSSNVRPLPPPLPVGEAGIAQHFLQEDRG